MEHYAPTHDLAHHWRTRTLIASTIAAVELVALIAVGIAVLGKGWFVHARSASASAAQRPAHHAAGRAGTKPEAGAAAATHHAAAPAKPMLPKAQTSVLVLNGNGQNGAAGAEARVLRARGYPVAAVGNARRSDYAASIVMYRPGYAREAQRLARALGVPNVSALDGLPASQLRGARLLLIVGR